MRVVFLDIDGVLNYKYSKSHVGMYTGIDTIRVKRLAKIVEATGAKIVLTSTWKDGFAVGKTKWEQPSELGRYLYNKLRRQHLFVYDKVSDKFSWRGRRLAIDDWLKKHPEVGEQYIVLDDEMFPNYYDHEFFPHLFKTIDKTSIDEWAGLTEDLTAQAIIALNGEMNDWDKLPQMDSYFLADWWEQYYRLPDKYDLMKII